MTIWWPWQFQNDLKMNTDSPALQWQSVSCHDHGPWTAQSRTCTCQARAWLWLYFSLHLRACPPLTVYRRYCTGNTWVRRSWQMSSLITNSSFFTNSCLAWEWWGPLSGSLCQEKYCDKLSPIAHLREVQKWRYVYTSLALALKPDHNWVTCFQIFYCSQIWMMWHAQACKAMLCACSIMFL